MKLTVPPGETIVDLRVTSYDGLTTWSLDHAQPHELREVASELSRCRDPKPLSIYLIGSLRNPKVPQVAAILRRQGFDVFDDWYAAGPEADGIWQRYEQSRFRPFPEALDGYHAEHTFAMDKHHLNRCHVGVLMLPAGKSGHLELGYLIGQGKPGFILLDGEQDPERWDVMYCFATGVVYTLDGLVMAIRRLSP